MLTVAQKDGFLWLPIICWHRVEEEWNLSCVQIMHLTVCCFSTVAAEQRVVITNKHGEKLVGLLHHMGTNKIVVLCHGFTASKVHNCVVTVILFKIWATTFHTSM